MCCERVYVRVCVCLCILCACVRAWVRVCGCLGVFMCVWGIDTQAIGRYACEIGSTEDVVAYCNCLARVNEEKLGRHSSEALRPLTLAAMHNHVPVMRVLMGFGAEVQAVDRRGRTALHWAALHGHKEACEFLLDKNTSMFAADHQVMALSSAPGAHTHMLTPSIHFAIIFIAPPSVALSDFSTHNHMLRTLNLFLPVFAD